MAAGTAEDGAGTAGGPGAPDSADAEIAELARAGEPDRYLAALLAPAAERNALLVLAAFATELARIPHRAVREPFMGEIRLQWWRDALERPEGESAGHGVADAVRLAMRACRLPAELLGGMIEARAAELQPAPFDDEAALLDFLWKTEGALFALSERILGGSAPVAGASPDAGGATGAAAAAGRAYGLARLLQGLPRSLALGRVPLARSQLARAGLSAEQLLAGSPADKIETLLQVCHAQILDDLAEARRLASRLPRPQRIAFLPLALVASYVRVQRRQLKRQGAGALREEAQVLPVTRVMRVAAAHAFGRL